MKQMLMLRKVLYLFFLKLVISLPQINFHRTAEWMDCIYLSYFDETSSSRHLIPYCSSAEWLTVNISLDSSVASIFNFSTLRENNVTGEDLYQWSAPIDTIESYQFYLSRFNEGLAENLFYNCTSPNFGPYCQYSVDIGFDLSSYSSLTQLIKSYYEEQMIIQPEISTCYIHLQCNRQLKSVCLDWSEICDGKFDCDDGIDENNCLQLTLNQCKDNEYRCNNGQCIPNIFLNTGHNDSQCLDQSDEYNTTIQYSFNLPLLSNEDTICSWRQNHTNEYDRLTPFSSSCLSQRHANIKEIILFDTSDSTLSNECLIALRCHLTISYNHQLFCYDFCENNTCIDTIKQKCPSMFFYPSIPVGFKSVYFLYTNTYLTNWTIMRQIPPEYICYDQELCSSKPEFNLHSYVLNNKTCYRFEDFGVSIDPNEGDWYSGYIKFVYSQFASCNPTKICNNQMYRCLNSSKCIPKSYLGDRIRDCPYGDDEIQIKPNRINLNSQQLTFPTICDGFVDLLPISIQGQNHTDETECQYWPCNNIYTRCDGIWNCANGADEINCNPSSSSSICPENYHSCFSVHTHEKICLPIAKAYDGIIDCVGGIDEPFLCPRKNRFDGPKFYCNNECLPWAYVCDGIRDCQHGDDEFICNSTSRNKKSKVSQLSTTDSSLFDCQRGLPLRALIDPKRNISTQVCLCPPQYYGDRCQYQNQRVSLTIQVNPSWTSEQAAYTCIVSLIDDSNEQIVHSYEQFSYFYPRDQHTKFNMYLQYVDRPKDTTKQYSVKIDLYDMYSLEYRGSVITPIKFPFLPVQRLAIQLDLPKAIDSVETANNTQCNQSWTGKYCNISYECHCSIFSLCAGITANGRSICVCPVDYYGPRCGIKKTACSDSPCQNGGFCLLSDEHMISYRPYTCICEEGFSGERCEIIDTKLNLTFDKNLDLPSRSLVYFHFINFVNHLTNNQKKNPLIVCGNELALSSYFPSKFQISFLELHPNQYYYIANQNTNNKSLTLDRIIRPSDRCPSINEIFNETLVQLPSIRRIKYYHLSCQQAFNLSCFYDDIYMCVCSTDPSHRSANCFQFNHNIEVENLLSYQLEILSQCNPLTPSSTVPSSVSSTSSSTVPSSASSTPSSTVPSSVSSTSSSTETSSVSTTITLHTTTTSNDNGVSSIYVGKYSLCLFYLVFYLLASYIY